MNPSVQGLRVFLSILERGSLSAAGRELGMTQPAVSNHLHALEEHFGVALLARGKPLRATPAGACLADHARRVVGGLESLESDMALHRAPRGRLLVGASSTPGELFLPGIAVAFADRYPDVALDVHIADTDETVAALLRREVEVAVTGDGAKDPRLVGTVVGRDELVFVAATAGAHGPPDRNWDGAAEASPEDLALWPLVLRERGSATRRTVEEGLAAVGVVPRVAMELGSNAAVAGAVVAGAGVGVLPERALATQPAVRRLAVRGLRLVRPFVLVTERGRPLSPAAEAFAGICAGEAA